MVAFDLRYSVPEIQVDLTLLVTALFSAPLYPCVCRNRAVCSHHQSSFRQIRHQCFSLAITRLSVVSWFLMDRSGPLVGGDPTKETSIIGPSQCQFSPAGGGQLLPLLLLPP